MKLTLAACALFLALVGIGVACGPTEKFCYKEGKTCKLVAGDEAIMGMQSDASDAMDAEKQCPDPVTGVLGPCPG